MEAPLVAVAAVPVCADHQTQPLLRAPIEISVPALLPWMLLSLDHTHEPNLNLKIAFPAHISNMVTHPPTTTITTP